MVNVVTFYRFVRLEDPAALQRRLFAAVSACGKIGGAARKAGLKGTVLIAREGINGTLSGEREDLEAIARELQSWDEFCGMEFKYSTANTSNPVFYRLKIKVKDEIVGFGQPGIAPDKVTGTHVDARAWNQLLADPEVLVLDTRNTYEVEIGGFPGAVDPGTRSFREFADFVRDNLDPGSQPKVAMFCTGGIRCEKASAFMLGEGFSEVYQLQGGILKYLETVERDDNRWQGECFVFDQRVSVDESLQEGSYEQCFACRRPLSEADRDHQDYEPGVSCARCVQELSTARAESFQERNRQVALADSRGQAHIGANQPASPPASDD
jgi:UPF0176 protein